MSAYDVVLEHESHTKTGQAIETAYGSHYYHDVPAYKSGNVIERTDKVYEPWFQWMHSERSGLPNAYKEPLRKMP
ncbi:NAD(P)-binding protein [Apiospora marii]|uniref:NAD(P)-binding protein n=1 Tax=Apiospora marii TaxID=335849 RepID=A0ABR1RLP3_9PEZI